MSKDKVDKKNKNNTNKEKVSVVKSYTKLVDKKINNKLLDKIEEEDSKIRSHDLEELLSDEDPSYYELENVYEDKAKKKEIIDNIESINYDINNVDINELRDNDTYSYEEFEELYNEKVKKKEMLENIRKEDKKIDSEKRKAWTRKNKKDLAIGIGITLVFIFFVVLYFVNKSLILVDYTKDELIGLNYKIVEDKLESRGFENIEIKEISDLKYEDKNKKELVTDVLIANRNTFNKNSKYTKNEKIIIIYHSLIKINPPLTDKEVKKMNYKEVEKQFKQNGFEVIKVEKITDLVTGWITKEGQVEIVTINKDKTFDTKSEFPIDSEVIIKYHTFKK